MRVLHGEEREQWGFCYGRAEVAGTVVPKGIHPGSWFSSRGSKHALVASRKARSALPPSLVPKRVDSERSWAIGVMWAALAHAKWGH